MEDGADEVDDAGGAPTETPADVAPVADADAAPSFRPTIDSSGWEINWPGAGALVLVVVVAAVGWGWLGGGSDDTVTTADGGTTAPATSPTTTTARMTTTTTVRAATTTIVTTTTVPERRVIISGDVKPCQFGDRCLAASFVIEGFDPHPGRFICIYPNSTSDFGFNDNDVIDACLTGDAGDTITIEVDGVRSATISETDLDGTG